jgi:hypothetical protein
VGSPWRAAPLLAVLGVGLPAAAAAQETSDAVRIRRILVESRGIFPEANGALLPKLADAFHATTHESVIRRELLFREGEVLDLERVAETERNLRRYPYFRDVRLRVEAVGDGEVDVHVETFDAWTTEIGIRGGSDGGETRFGASVQENNFLGLGKRLGFELQVGPDRTTNQLLYEDPQLFDGAAVLQLAAGINSDGTHYRVHVGREFRTVDTPWGATVTLEQNAFDTRIWNSAVETARWQTQARFGEISAGRLLTPEGGRPLTRVFAGFRYQERNFAEDPEFVSSSPAPSPRRFGFLYSRLEWIRPDWLATQGVARLARTEDIDLGSTASVELGWSPPFFAGESAWSGQLLLSHGIRIPNGYLRGDLQASSRYQGGLPANTLAQAQLLAVWKPSEASRHTLLARGLVGAGWALDEDVQLAADGTTGLRGYRVHSYTGDRRVLLNLEDRMLMTGELAHFFQLGAAGFVDAGYAWPKGAPWRFSDLRTDVGVGLRIQLTRASHNGLIRLDLAWPLQPDPLGRRAPLLSFSGSQAF